MLVAVQDDWVAQGTAEPAPFSRICGINFFEYSGFMYEQVFAYSGCMCEHAWITFGILV